MILEFQEVTGLRKGFFLENINFSVEAGYLVGITGKNGAGKTTLLHYILDRKKRYTGRIMLKGQDIHKDHVSFMNHIGFVSDENSFFSAYTAIENVKLLSIFYKDWDQKQFLNAIKEMGVSAGRKLEAMSRGEYLKFQMAFAMAHHPALYLLDEVTGGLDPIFKKEFFRIIHQILATENASILMTTHIQEEIEEKMDFVGIMDGGKLISYKENFS